MKILLTGKTGLLGHDIYNTISKKHVVYAPSRDELNLSDPEKIKSFFKKECFDVVIHTAAYTAVDKAETEKELCYRINFDAVKCIADECKKTDAALVFFSTDYVFDGKKEAPYETDDKKAPLNYYGYTKAITEDYIQNTLKKYFIVRTSWLFGIKRDCFATNILKKEKIYAVCDQYASPTYTKDEAEKILPLAMTGKYGIYHITNEKYCSVYEYAKKILSVCNKDISIEPVYAKNWHSVAKRPLNSRLSKKSLDAAGLKRLPPWTLSIEKFFKEEYALKKQREA